MMAALVGVPLQPPYFEGVEFIYQGFGNIWTNHGAEF